MALPAELRNRVDRFALLEDHHIEVTVNGLEAPGLLSVCKEVGAFLLYGIDRELAVNRFSQVRREAGSIYYSENMFESRLDDYDARATCFLGSKAMSVAREFGIRMPLRMRTANLQPHWNNLLHWLRYYHTGRVTASYNQESVDMLSEDRDSHTPAQAAMLTSAAIFKAMFRTLGALKGREWQQVKPVMGEFRDALGAVDTRWLSDG